jgi:hypothetical protein
MDSETREREMVCYMTCTNMERGSSPKLPPNSVKVTVRKWVDNSKKIAGLKILFLQKTMGLLSVLRLSIDLNNAS